MDLVVLVVVQGLFVDVHAFFIILQRQATVAALDVKMVAFHLSVYF